MPQELKADVVVIGGGLTGLTTAFYLKKAGKKVFLIEKSNRVGGVINTVNEKGFVLEAGPNSGVLGSSEAMALFEDLGERCELEIANQEAKKRLIWKDSDWQPLPSGVLSGITTPLFTWGDKFRILTEPFRRRGKNPDESVAELVKRRLGQSFLDYAVDPFISGIYAGNPNEIITKYALPKLYNLEHKYGSFIKGSILKKPDTLPDGYKKPTREVFSAKDGLGKMVDALDRAIGSDCIITECTNITINPSLKPLSVIFNKRQEEISITADFVVTTVGAYVLPELLPFIPKVELEPIKNLKYAKVVQVALGYYEWKGIALDAFGGLVPSVENRKILGALYSSTLFTKRAPEKGALISVFMGGMRNPEAINKSDEEITTIVLDEIREMQKLEDPNPDLIKIFRYEHAIPQYDKTSGDRLRQISMLEEKYPGLILAGNIRDGIGMSDRIKQGRIIADSLSSI